jgi:hypothetical protein
MTGRQDRNGRGDPDCLFGGGAKLYRPLAVPKTKGRQNMSEEGERRLIETASDPKSPRRLLAGHCLGVMGNIFLFPSSFP